MKLLQTLSFALLTILITTSAFATDCVFVVQVDNADMFATEMSLTGSGTVSASIGAAIASYTRDEVNELETLKIVMPNAASAAPSHKMDSLPASGLTMTSENLVVSLFCKK